MTVPTAPVFSATALTAAHAAFVAVIDSGAGAGSIKVRDAAGVLLGQVGLSDPCGSVNASTGRLTFAIAGAATWVASGNAAYAEVCDSTGAVHGALPCAAGTAPLAGYLVLNTLTVLGGGPVTVISAVMG